MSGGPLSSPPLLTRRASRFACAGRRWPGLSLTMFFHGSALSCKSQPAFSTRRASMHDHADSLSISFLRHARARKVARSLKLKLNLNRSTQNNRRPLSKIVVENVFKQDARSCKVEKQKIRQKGVVVHGVAGSEEWGEYLRRRRRQSGLTQADLATIANVAIRSIHALEAGKETARIDILIKVAKALGLSLTLSSATSSATLTPPRKTNRTSVTAPQTQERKTPHAGSSAGSVY